MYHQGVYINEAQFQKIRQVAITAAEKKIPIIVLPCHKSHIDYLVISYIFVRLGLAVPYIAAGDNLDLPVIGTILRRGGAFYIRRSWTDDKLYGLVATEYIHEVLAKGHNMEVFIEGTRSRTGKLLNPKFGILNIILDGLLNQKYKDCLILPISIGYDRVIETSSYVNELLGIPKEKESLMGILSSSNIIQLKWGRVDIRFSDPFFLKEFIDIEMVKRKDDNPVIDNKIILRALGYRVMSDINNTSVVMPTALVGTVLLTLRGRGVGFIELIRRVEWLITHILLKGGRVAHFGDMKLDDVVLKAIKIIKDLIGTRVGLVEPVYFAINRFELSFYRNQVIHIFISEAIVSVAMYTIIKKGGSKLDQRIPFDKLLQDCIFLSKLLKWEFVYPPGNIKDNLLSTIDFLEKSKVINFDGENVELSDNERNSGRENYDFYCFLIWPFVESYWLSTVSVFTILSNQNSTNTSISYIEENEFKNKIQQLGKTLYYEGDLSYLEAINKETINNGFKFLVENEVLMKKNNFVYVNQEYLNNNQEDLSNSKLWQLVDTIGKFRREGKNRRDNQTVSSRVLRLAELVGKNGWNNTKLATAKNSTNPPKL
ncbi:acyltransferase [Neoconidiobolus thromboides FSU 785]|nr:acyltransferase [Neoconidiobolus thromboides FSU 785]